MEWEVGLQYWEFNQKVDPPPPANIKNARLDNVKSA